MRYTVSWSSPDASFALRGKVAAGASLAWQPMKNREIQAAWKYHDGSKHSYWSVRNSPHFLDWANRPYGDLKPLREHTLREGLADHPELLAKLLAHA